MKITDVEVVVVRQDEVKMIGDGSQDTAVILVHTDEGITGIGEVDSAPEVVKMIVDAPASHDQCRGLKQLLVGEDPTRVEYLWYKMYYYSYYYGRRSVVIHAMSGIDIALWDITGKKLGVSVSRLIGGRFRETIPAYCSVLMPETKEEIDALVAHHKADCNYKGFKFGWGALGRDEQKDIKLVEYCRQAVGDDMRLMIDIGMRWTDYKYALRVSKEYEKQKIYWLEEPFAPDRTADFGRLADNINVSLASGEEFGTMYEFDEMLTNGKVDIVQPDMSRCGGITMAKKIADMAELRGKKLIPHAFKTGILMGATLQLIASIPNADMLEYCAQETVLSKNLVRHHFKLDANGNVTIPDVPGIGVELNEEVLDRYRRK
ncbi:MAG: mandelate racemase/muconate lactonizing enzyme family protein [Clostridia bacterium]|nr:mandelate racemase/muconate lactonizing enzyme family protein [Clostridia bacterium]